MSDFIVVDASLALKWLVEEEASDKAEAVLEDCDRRGTTLVAPYLMPFEVVNALHGRVRRGELTVEQSSSLVEDRISSEIALHHAPTLHRRTMELAQELGQGATYDAHYLALAEILDCEIWTADERFYRSASPRATRLRLLSEFVVLESTG